MTCVTVRSFTNTVICPMNVRIKQHWETIYQTKQPNEVSWTEEKPSVSLDLIHSFNPSKSAKIIDIGGGDSYLIDNLLDLGYTNLYLLDISENAIERAKKRLAERAKNVTFIVSDSLDFIAEQEFDLWHDRASFHFITNENDVLKYKSNVLSALHSKGHFILGTFSEDGPKKCSGLDITQYSVEKLEGVFEEDFELENCFTEDHETPFDTIQNFIFAHYIKR